MTNDETEAARRRPPPPPPRPSTQYAHTSPQHGAHAGPQHSARAGPSVAQMSPQHVAPHIAPQHGAHVSPQHLSHMSPQHSAHMGSQHNAQIAQQTSPQHTAHMSPQLKAQLAIQPVRPPEPKPRTQPPPRLIRPSEHLAIVERARERRVPPLTPTVSVVHGPRTTQPPAVSHAPSHSTAIVPHVPLTPRTHSSHSNALVPHIPLHSQPSSHSTALLPHVPQSSLGPSSHSTALVPHMPILPHSSLPAPYTSPPPPALRPRTAPQTRMTAPVSPPVMRLPQPRKDIQGDAVTQSGPWPPTTKVSTFSDPAPSRPSLGPVGLEDLYPPHPSSDTWDGQLDADHRL
ncbi:hypothetical protein RR48_12759 [Papilio machaon]|uniref:Uncharacterized protein n=1 Tax=Papilio machaon TaxID=76193 RepID=A0A194QQZ6_PAPMA|nr:hypothetical protein RR48_12759 [Papilio machaon]